MKKRIGSLKGKPIIEGDINLKNASEIHISELNGGSGSGSSSGDDKVIYYAVKNPAFLSGPLPIANIKLKLVGGEIVFYPKGYISETATVIAVAFMPVIMERSINDGPVEYLRINSIEECLEVLQSESNRGSNFSDMFIGRITAEEYWEHFKDE